MADFDVLSIDLRQADAPTKFAQSLRETGFAVLKNHSLSSNDINAMYDVWSDWFATDKKEIFAVKPNQSNGYFGYKSENAKGATHKDLKEFFHVYQDKPVLKWWRKSPALSIQNLLKLVKCS